MTPIDSRRIRRPSSSFAALALLVICGSGCAATSQALSGISNWHLVKAQEKHELADIRRDTRTELAEQRQQALKADSERNMAEARLAAERQALEAEMCRVNQEAINERIRGNLKETVDSKLAINLQHGLELGELEVDVEALQQLLKEREALKEQPPFSPFTGPPQSPVKGPPCACCDQPCGCEPGLVRRLCPRCRHKPCEAEKKCGGPETVEALTQQQPLKQPLRPAEIPLKLPVRLTFGMQNPQLEQSRIRRVPNVPTQPFTGGPCDKHCLDPNGNCIHGHKDCVNGAAGAGAMGNGATNGGASTRRAAAPSTEVIDIPKPVPDDQAHRLELPPSYAVPANLQFPVGR